MLLNLMCRQILSSVLASVLLQLVLHATVVAASDADHRRCCFL